MINGFALCGELCVSRLLERVAGKCGMVRTDWDGDAVERDGDVVGWIWGVGRGKVACKGPDDGGGGGCEDGGCGEVDGEVDGEEVVVLHYYYCLVVVTGKQEKRERSRLNE